MRQSHLKTLDHSAALKAFRPAQKGDRVTCAYLYADRYVLVWFERWIRDVDKRVNYVKVGRLAPDFLCRFKGARIVFHKYGGVARLQAMLMLGAREVVASVRSLDHGSEKTKAMGVKTGVVTWVHARIGDIHDYQLSHLSSDISYDVYDDNDERRERDTWANILAAETWSDYAIVEKIDCEG
jgi:hypothetical protein